MISKYLTLADCTRSAKATKLGILNVPNEAQKEAISLVAVNIFDKVKEQFPTAFVTSFFRNTHLNHAVGGSRTSQHCKGEAIDIDSKSDNTEIFNWVKENLIFDQLIREHPDKDGNPAWVHISFKKKGNRKQVLTIKK